MAQVELAEHQGVDAEGTATERYGPKEASAIVMKTLPNEAFLSLPCTCLQSQKSYVLLIFLEISQQILFEIYCRKEVCQGDL